LVFNQYSTAVKDISIIQEYLDQVSLSVGSDGPQLVWVEWKWDKKWGFRVGGEGYAGKSERSFPAFVFPLKQLKTANAVTQTPHTHVLLKTHTLTLRANTKKW